LNYFRLIEKLPGRTALGFGPGSGRWNPYGTPFIYASSHTSLNFLELLSIKGPVVTLAKWSLVQIEIEDDLPYLGIEYLPNDWDRRPHSKSTQSIGNYWAKQQDSYALKVPSCRIPLINYPKEHNLLINPLHPEFIEKVKLIEETDVSFAINRI
jgi:RES domain-containing protein